jgi:hypothetical protein
MIDHVQIDLKRYGIPRIDQHKIPIPPAKGPKGAKEIEGGIAAGQTPSNAKIDSTTASKRLLTSPPPSKTKKKPPH